MFSLYGDSFQFVLKIFISEISKENKMLFLCFKETTTTVNQTKKKGKREGPESAVCVVVTLPF